MTLGDGEIIKLALFFVSIYIFRWRQCLCVWVGKIERKKGKRCTSRHLRIVCTQFFRYCSVSFVTSQGRLDSISFFCYYYYYFVAAIYKWDSVKIKFLSLTEIALTHHHVSSVLIYLTFWIDFADSQMDRCLCSCCCIVRIQTVTGIHIFIAYFRCEARQMR